MLKLNKFEEDYERVFRRAPKVLAKREPQVLDSTLTPYDRQQATFVVASKYIQLAYLNYWLEHFDEVKPNLQKAAPYAFLRGFDPELKTSNVDWTIQQELNIVILFAESDIINKLSTTSWCLPDDNIINQACYLYDHLLLKIGTGQTPPLTDISDAITEAKATKDKDVQQYILPLIEAISALVSGDKALWQSSIDKAVAWHADECKFGDYKDMIDGFICLNALTMAKLGKDLHGWQCDTDSLYLPLFLID
ncbi:Imm49 family immunity protein [Rheinheimera sp. MMS21-TC3]|uniref:Imm49 family immunity protein n=1 Tax=Rheinheimera sp. MMS21-TC3 TaxID=3072790 RepID=UPI0028C48F94|nr:Imm49 family immunity protein [Rheinheimera sp. MMS21-TC3]WNO60349.1 Imm49 family immunity protein [Rheinheimera sp. MMS21-TC3]